MPNVYVVPRNKLLALLAKLFPVGPQGIPCVNDCTCAAPAPSRVERPVEFPLCDIVPLTAVDEALIAGMACSDSPSLVRLGPGSDAYDAVANALPRDTDLVMSRVTRTRGQAYRVDYYAVAEVRGITHRMRGEDVGDVVKVAARLRSELEALMRGYEAKLKKPDIFQGWDKAKQ